MGALLLFHQARMSSSFAAPFETRAAARFASATRARASLMLREGLVSGEFGAEFYLEHDFSGNLLDKGIDASLPCELAVLTHPMLEVGCERILGERESDSDCVVALEDLQVVHRCGRCAITGIVDTRDSAQAPERFRLSGLRVIEKVARLVT
jgi:hypothetical protein